MKTGALFIAGLAATGIALMADSKKAVGQNADAELWTGVELAKSVTNGLTLGFEEEIRIDDNISSVKTVFSQVSASYSFNKYIKAKGAYRFAQKPLDIGGFSSRHRFNMDLTFRYKAKPVIAYFRTRYQVG
ncbi:MAG: DUF2490 domain-containing protein, partial [Flavobacteriales bacterium]